MAHVAAHRPVKVGFHIPAWLSYFVSLSEVAPPGSNIRRAENWTTSRTSRNQYAAEPWVESHAARSEDAILALCDDRPRGKVPGPVDGKERVSVLLATVDTQQHYFRYVIRAYGYGETEESWLVASGSADNLAALEEILFGSVYADPDGREYAVKAAMIDAMGGRTAEVYRWAVRHRGASSRGRASVRWAAHPPRIRNTLPRRQGQQGQDPRRADAVPLRRDVLQVRSGVQARHPPG